MDDRPLPVRAVVDGQQFHGAYDDLVQQVATYAASLACADGAATSKQRKALARKRASELRGAVKVLEVDLDGLPNTRACELTFKELRRTFTSVYRRTKGCDDDDLIAMLDSLIGEL